VVCANILTIYVCLAMSYFLPPQYLQSMTCPPQGLIPNSLSNANKRNEIKTMSPNCYCVIPSAHYLGKSPLTCRSSYFLALESRAAHTQPGGIYLHVSSHLARGLIFLRFLAPAELFFRSCAYAR